MAPIFVLLIKAALPSVVSKVVNKLTTPKQEPKMDILMGLLRHALTAGGGALATAGVIGASDVEAVVGAVITIIGAVLSAWSKRKGGDSVGG